jgi:glycolate oxidase
VALTLNELKQEDINFLAGITGPENFFSQGDELEKFSQDETEDLKFLPELLLKPETTNEVSQILSYCNGNGIPVTPVGARTGLSGGALCVHGGVALSMERFNSIIRIDEQNQQVITEPGVITQVLQEAVAEKGLYYAPDPASRGSCFIGGNLAENSGGPRAVKYGVTKDWVLNLEVVLPNGQVIWTGANTLKNSTGYNLTQLFVGSEGTLGVITKAVLKLLPLPRVNMLMLAPFERSEKACEAVAAIFRSGIVPSALEFMERSAIVLAMKFTEKETITLGENDQAHLLIEVDGLESESVLKQCEVIGGVLESFGCSDVHFAEDQSQKDQLWFLRRKVGEAVKAHSIYKEEDTVVPRAELPRLLAGVKKIGQKYGFESVCYGHAGDGNLHVNILKSEMSDDDWSSMLPIAIKELFEYTVGLGGTLSGEHGIGYVQKEYMPIAFSKIELDLMMSIKALFDPHGIMNPGKIFPESP